MTKRNLGIRGFNRENYLRWPWIIRSVIEGRCLWISALAIFFAGSLLGCGSREDEKKVYVPTDLCVIQAREKIAMSGEPYAKRGGPYIDVLLGGQWLHVPSGYLLLINSGYSKEMPGLSLILKTSAPDLKPRVPGGPRRPRGPEIRPKNVIITLTCYPTHGDFRFVERERTRTKASILNDERYVGIFPGYDKQIILDDLGLEEYARDPNNPRSSAIYFPLDHEVTNPNGGVLPIKCFSRDQKAKYKESCLVRYNLFKRENPEIRISVKYDFPIQQLRHWRKIYDFSVNLVQTMIKEGDQLDVKSNH